jgi:hypothetical protein
VGEKFERDFLSGGGARRSRDYRQFVDVTILESRGFLLRGALGAQNFGPGEKLFLFTLGQLMKTGNEGPASLGFQFFGFS